MNTENTVAEGMEAVAEVANGNGGAVGLAIVGGMLLGAAVVEAIHLARKVIASKRDPFKDFDDYEDESESVTVNPVEEKDND